MENYFILVHSLRICYVIIHTYFAPLGKLFLEQIVFLVCLYKSQILELISITTIGIIITKFHHDLGRGNAAATTPANPHLRIPPPAVIMTTTTPTDRQMTATTHVR